MVDNGQNNLQQRGNNIQKMSTYSQNKHLINNPALSFIRANSARKLASNMAMSESRMSDGRMSDSRTSDGRMSDIKLESHMDEVKPNMSKNVSNK